MGMLTMMVENTRHPDMKAVAAVMIEWYRTAVAAEGHCGRGSSHTRGAGHGKHRATMMALPLQGKCRTLCKRFRSGR